MKMTDALPYVTARGIDPRTEVECAGCPNHFPIAMGVAWPARIGEEDIRIVYFCSLLCVLEVLNPLSMGRA